MTKCKYKCPTLPYLTVAHLVVVLVSHVDLEGVHTCRKDIKKKI